MENIKMEHKKIGTIKNYYGGLHIKEEEGLFYWALKDIGTYYGWQEIPESLYRELEHFGEISELKERVLNGDLIGAKFEIYNGSCAGIYCYEHKQSEFESIEEAKKAIDWLKENSKRKGKFKICEVLTGEEILIVL